MTDADTLKVPSDPRPGASARALELRRHLPLLAAALVVVIAARVTVVAAWRGTFAIFGRDQGIFQYVAWAIRHGERAYLDFREINGPLPHAWHIAFQWLGGTEEHRFRVLDLIVSSTIFMFAGAVMPGLGARADRTDRAPTAIERGLWAAAAWTLLMAQYVVYGWWQTAQRESFYNWFFLASTALLALALAPASATLPLRIGERGRTSLFVAAGFVGALTWWGKPTCLLFSALQGLVILFVDDALVPRRRALARFVLGTIGAALVMTAFVLVVGDFGNFVRIVFGEVPRLYRYIWKLAPLDAYRAWNNAPRLDHAFATIAIALVVLALRLVPRRFAVLLPILLLGVVAFFVQGKGFPYHLHPITAGTQLVWLGAAVLLTEKAREGRAVLTGLAVVGSGAIGYQAYTNAALSEAMQHDWPSVGPTREARTTEKYFHAFPWGDYFSWELRQAAAFVRANTRPDDRIQTYGMDPYVLFLSERRSATPYIYSFELNVDAALRGGSGGAPDAKEREWLLATARRHEDELLVALEKTPPAAFVLIDHAPFTYPPDSVVDFEEHCPRASAWMRERYEAAERFGHVRVWLKRTK